MADVVPLTVVASQGEADVICSFLRSEGIECSDRATDISGEGGWGGWREIVVAQPDLDDARQLLATAADRDR